MINIYDLNFEKTAVLENAFQITETQEINNIYTLTFRLPANDEKLQFCKGFHFAQYDDGQMYRIVKIDHDENDVATVLISCEHVIATLCDNVMFGSFIYGGENVHTREVIEWLLGQQSIPYWTLDECDFDFEYEYGWEQENLLNALYAIPKQFVTPYRWTFDTSSLPWTVSLKAIDEDAAPEYFIRAKINLLSSSKSSDYAEICTRLYPLGYGDGINQLTIRSANNDIPYLEASPEMVAEYGIKEKVLVDRSYDNAESLKAYAETVFASIQAPSASRSFDVVDLYPITSKDIDNAEVGKICRMTGDGTKAYITKTTRVLDDPGNLQIEISTKTNNVVNQIADLADRVRIESVYAQGATQLYQHSKDANATPTKGMIVSLYFPQEMKQINKVLIRLQLKQFRAYSQTTAAGGGSTPTSADGGGVATSSVCESTGGTYSVNSIGTWSQGDTAVYTSVQMGEGASHYHAIDRLRDFKHNHDFSTSGTQSHRHTITIPAHDHSVPIPAHTHAIESGIYESGSPSACDIYVSGQMKAQVSGTSYDGDITQWLLDSNGLIPRGRWIDVEIRPNDKSYVVCSVFVQGFVQSRGGGNY